jgi:hypothetical protein
MLQNRIYRGEITHKGNAYPGEHPAIVEKELWDEVQGVLAENRVDRASGSHAKHPSLLVGMAFDENGERLTPTHAVTNRGLPSLHSRNSRRATTQRHVSSRTVVSRFGREALG